MPLLLVTSMAPPWVVSLPSVTLPAAPPSVLPVIVMVPVPWVLNSRFAPSALAVRSIPPAPSPTWLRVCSVRLRLFCSSTCALPNVPEVVMVCFACRTMSAFKPSISDSYTVVGDASVKAIVPAVAAP